MAEDGLLKRHQTPANLEKILRMKLTDDGKELQNAKSPVEIIKNLFAGDVEK